MDLPFWIPQQEKTEAFISYAVLLRAWGEAKLNAAITQFIDSLMRDGFHPRGCPYPGSPSSALWTISKRVVRDAGTRGESNCHKHAWLLKCVVETVIASYLKKDEGLEWLLDPRSLAGLKWQSQRDRIIEKSKSRSPVYPRRPIEQAALKAIQQGLWKDSEPLTKLRDIVVKNLSYEYVEGRFEGSRAVYEHLRKMRKLKML